jgi:hypothetical protein
VFDPSPANIEARVTRVTLPSGLKLVLLPKKTRGGTVVASVQLHFGDEKSLASKGAAPRLAGALLMRGTQKHTRQQLQDEFDKIKARVNVNGTLTGAAASIDTLRAFLPGVRFRADPAGVDCTARGGAQRAAKHGQYRHEPISECRLSSRRSALHVDHR